MAKRLEQLTRITGDLAAEDYPELWEALTDAGKEAFAREVTEAFLKAAPEDQTPAISEVIQAWLRTLLLRETPGYAEAMERVGKTPEELGERVYTLEELRERLDLPPKP